MAITTRKTIIENLAAGKGQVLSYIDISTASATAGNSTSGFFTLRSSFNAIGTSLPATRVGILSPDSTTQTLAVNMLRVCDAGSKCGWYGRFYELGTINLVTAAGDNFVHAGTFTSISRTIYGEATKPITMIPIIFVTTALTGFAAELKIATAAAGTGYKDESGNSVVGTKSFTFPSATTAVQSMFVMPVEVGDAGVQDIVMITTVVAATAGVVTIFGFEPIIPYSNLGLGVVSNYDSVFSGVNMPDLEPGTPNDGSVTSYLGFLGINGNNSTGGGWIISVTN